MVGLLRREGIVQTHIVSLEVSIVLEANLQHNHFFDLLDNLFLDLLDLFVANLNCSLCTDSMQLNISIEHKLVFKLWRWISEQFKFEYCTHFRNSDQKFLRHLNHFRIRVEISDDFSFLYSGYIKARNLWFLFPLALFFK